MTDAVAVIDVIDGDTVRIAYRGETSVRVLGIDTPETVHPDHPVDCGGRHASVVAHRLLGGRTVRLVLDPSEDRLDSYGRTLGYVQVAGAGDYGLTMLRRGLAVTDEGPVAFARQRRYLAAESHARAARRGLWARCPGTGR